MIIIIQIILLIIFCGIATYTDLKTGEIPNWITYSMILIGIIINSIFYLNNLIISIIISILLYVFGLIVSKFGMGGGDIKLYIGINMILPIYNNNIFILHTLLLSNILGYIYMAIVKKKAVRFAPFIFIAITILIYIYEVFSI